MMSFFPYNSVSEFFEAEGDFEENTASFNVDDEDVRWFLNEDAAPYPYPEHLQAEHFPDDFRTAYESEEEAVAAAEEMFPEPCCYNSSRNFGTGEHEYGCPNY